MRWARAKLRAISTRLAWTSSVGHADQPRHLAGMGRNDHVAPFAACQPVGVAIEGVQSVGVDDQRHVGPVDKSLDEGARSRRPVPGRGRWR